MSLSRKKARLAPDFQDIDEKLRLLTSHYQPRTGHRPGEAGGVIDHPKISVIMPSYNQARFLERSILSVLNQGYPNLEFFILDGGSKDGSVEIIKKYETNITYWRSGPDDGQAAAINEGLERATGEWLGFQNSDDLYLPGAFDLVRKVAQRNKDAEFIHGDIVLIDESGNVFDVVHTLRARRWLHYFLGQHIFNHAAFWSKGLMDRVGFMNGEMEFAFDYEYFVRLLEAKPAVSHVAEYLGAFRQHESSKSSTIFDVCVKESRATVDRFAPAWARLIPAPIRQIIGRIIKSIGLITNGEFWYLVRKLRPPLE